MWQAGRWGRVSFFKLIKLAAPFQNFPQLRYEVIWYL
jgi:hypothetical protein